MGLQIDTDCSRYSGMHLNLQELLGEGSFSEVYREIVDADGRSIASKRVSFLRCPEECAVYELRILRKLSGQNNIINYLGCRRNTLHLEIFLEYFPHDSFLDWFDQSDAAEIRSYMKNLLSALVVLEKAGIVHRDIKPSNFLYNREQRRYALVDFGLARFQDSPPRKPLARLKDNEPERNARRKLFVSDQQKETKKRPRRKTPSPRKELPGKKCRCKGTWNLCEVCLEKNFEEAHWGGTAGYRAPEILLKAQQQTTAIDVYAAGVILLSLLSARYPFFRPMTDGAAIMEQMRIFGTGILRKLAKSLGKEIRIKGSFQRLNLRTLCELYRYDKWTSDKKIPGTTEGSTAVTDPLLNRNKVPDGSDLIRRLSNCLGSRETRENTGDAKRRLSTSNESESRAAKMVRLSREGTVTGPTTTKAAPMRLRTNHCITCSTNLDAMTSLPCCICYGKPHTWPEDVLAADSLCGIGTDVYNLLEGLMEPDPTRRLTASAALQHAVFE